LISKKEGVLVKRKIKKQVKTPVEEKKELDKKTIGKFKKILLKEREQIVGDVKQIVESSKEMGQDGTQDIGDEAANIYNKQVLLSLNENERMRLQ
jgi:RNA polymerase-binding transcription factor DksA